MLVEFYGVEPGFPLTTHLITRSMESAFPKRLYFVSVPNNLVRTARPHACALSTQTGCWLVQPHLLALSRTRAVLHAQQPIVSAVVTCALCLVSVVCAQVSDALLSLLLADEREALKITSTGLKLFERQEMKGKQTSTCMYRIAQVRAGAQVVKVQAWIWLGCWPAQRACSASRPQFREQCCCVCAFCCVCRRACLSCCHT